MTTEIMVWTLIFFGLDIGILAWLSTIAIRSDRDKVHDD